MRTQHPVDPTCIEALQVVAGFEPLVAQKFDQRLRVCTVRRSRNEAIAQIDLACCLAALGEPEEAARLGAEALDSSRVVDSVLTRAADLDASLRRAHPRLAETSGFTATLAAARSQPPGPGVHT